jgi:oligopeptide/dipeptide ABC transporter ATP-binding protein
LNESSNNNLLNIQNLSTHFFTEDGIAKAVDGLDLVVSTGETLGIVGESGCGKSMTALSILRLVPDPPGRIVAGKIFFDGVNLLELGDLEMRKIRGNEISMIFQEPMTSLNPVFTIGDQLSETFRFHLRLSKKEALNRSVELLKTVGIPSAESRIKDYPHQLSGGMRQRVMIAIALSCDPKLMIADEPTTALDVTIQAQILDLMRELKEKTQAAIILITHDLGVVAETAQRVAVMYAGRIYEFAKADDLFDNPLHPYTKGLMQSIPTIETKVDQLHVIPGVVPSLRNLPAGCKFGDRCEHAWDKCRKQEPRLIEVSQEHLVRCWLYND